MMQRNWLVCTKMIGHEKHKPVLDKMKSDNMPVTPAVMQHALIIVSPTKQKVVQSLPVSRNTVCICSLFYRYMIVTIHKVGWCLHLSLQSCDQFYCDQIIMGRWKACKRAFLCLVPDDLLPYKLTRKFMASPLCLCLASQSQTDGMTWGGHTTVLTPVFPTLFIPTTA